MILYKNIFILLIFSFILQNILNMLNITEYRSYKIYKISNNFQINLDFVIILI